MRGAEGPLFARRPLTVAAPRSSLQMCPSTSPDAERASAAPSAAEVWTTTQGAAAAPNACSAALARARSTGSGSSGAADGSMVRDSVRDWLSKFDDDPYEKES